MDKMRTQRIPKGLVVRLGEHAARFNILQGGFIMAMGVSEGSALTVVAGMVIAAFGWIGSLPASSFPPQEWRSIDDLPPQGDEDDEFEERCVVVWQDAEHDTDQGVEVTCLAHIRDGDYHQERYLNPVWRAVTDAPVFRAQSKS